MSVCMYTRTKIVNTRNRMQLLLLIAIYRQK